MILDSIMRCITCYNATSCPDNHRGRRRYGQSRQNLLVKCYLIFRVLLIEVWLISDYSQTQQECDNISQSVGSSEPRAFCSVEYASPSRHSSASRHHNVDKHTRKWRINTRPV